MPFHSCLSAFLFLIVCSAWPQSLKEEKNTPPAQEVAKLSDVELISCLDSYSSCEVDRDAVEDRLIKERKIDSLVVAFDVPPKGTPRKYLRDVIAPLLYSISKQGDDPRIDHFMREHLSRGRDRGDYYVARYLSKKGDLKALSILANNCYEYPISSLEWSFTLEEFGKQGYRPAIPCLIKVVDAVSLNAAGAAYDSLQIFYPDAPKHIPTPEEAARYVRPGG